MSKLILRPQGRASIAGSAPLSLHGAALRIKQLAFSGISTGLYTRLRRSLSSRDSSQASQVLPLAAPDIASSTPSQNSSRDETAFGSDDTDGEISCPLSCRLSARTLSAIPSTAQSSIGMVVRLSFIDLPVLYRAMAIALNGFAAFNETILG